MAKSFILLLSFFIIIGCYQNKKYDNIFIAIQHGDLNDVQTHLRSGTPLETKKDHNVTPLGYALEIKDYSIAEFLLKKGAHPAAYLGECMVRKDTTALKLLMSFMTDTMGYSKLDNLVQELKKNGYPEEYIIADFRKIRN